MPNQPHLIAPTVLRPARVFLEPTLTRDGTLDGAWWPCSTDLSRELSALVNILQDRLGPVLRVRLDLTSWDDVPAHLLIDGRFLRVSGLPATSDVIHVILDDQDGFLLLVIPPDTSAPIATAAMATAARTGNTLSASEILAYCRSPVYRSLRIRPYRASDREAVLSLADADRLPGQLVCTPATLDEALAGTSHRDPAPWARFQHPRTDVLMDADGQVAGAVSYATHRHHNTGQILWLHGQEVLDVVETLVDHTLRALGGRKAIDAFTSVPGLGLGALPTGRRPVTAKVLEHAGFAGRASWRYLRRSAPPEIDTAAHLQVEVVSSTTPPGWWLKAHGDGCSAELVVEEPVNGHGVVWWFGGDTRHTDVLLERALLREVGTILGEHGASETILYAAGDPEPDQTLFAAAGYTEIDRLVSYTRQATPTS